MSHVETTKQENVAILTLARSKVNALNPDVVEDLRSALRRAVSDKEVAALLITGTGSFFSFGFDVPELISYEKPAFKRFVQGFTSLYLDIFQCPKPVVAALNGHTVAGGCMLALACDYRVMAKGRSKIGLNEVTFGASVFAGSVEMLCHLVGHRNAERILFTGELYSGERAFALGLVDEVCDAEETMATSMRAARTFTTCDATAQHSIKQILRRPVADRMRALEEASIEDFVEIWYSPGTREQLKSIRIR